MPASETAPKPGRRRSSALGRAKAAAAQGVEGALTRPTSANLSMAIYLMFRPPQMALFAPRFLTSAGIPGPVASVLAAVATAEHDLMAKAEASLAKLSKQVLHLEASLAPFLLALRGLVSQLVEAVAGSSDGEGGGGSGKPSLDYMGLLDRLGSLTWSMRALNKDAAEVFELTTGVLDVLHAAAAMDEDSFMVGVRRLIRLRCSAVQYSAVDFIPLWSHLP